VCASSLTFWAGSARSGRRSTRIVARSTRRADRGPAAGIVTRTTGGTCGKARLNGDVARRARHTRRGPASAVLPRGAIDTCGRPTRGSIGARIAVQASTLLGQRLVLAGVARSASRRATGGRVLARGAVGASNLRRGQRRRNASST